MKQMNSFFRMSSLAVAALAITASCSNEELDGVNGLSKANTFITATFEQPDGGINTRTTLGVHNEVLWQSGDKFRLFYGSSESAVFTTEGSGESVTFGANITGNISGATYAIFPIMTNVDVTLSGTTATTTLRKEIPFSEATNGPMWADASADLTNLSFKHLAGLLKLTVSGLPTGKELVLKVTADKNIAGTATVELNPGSGEPYLEVSDAAGATGVEKEITVTGVQAVDGKATVFYVPLPVKTLGELKVNIYDKNDTSTPLYKEKKWTNIAVARAMIRSASFGFEVVDLNDSNAKTISQAIENAVPSGEASSATTTTVEIKGSVDATSNTANKTISVPAAENKNVALNFDQAPTTSESSALTIQNTTTTSQTDAVNTITLSLPATTNAVANVEINTPQSTFELTSSATADSEKTKYTTITAKTANNTLVVGDKVEIETINVKGGNIRLKKGSTVKTITNSTNGKIIVYKESGATLTTEPAEGSNIEVIDTDLDANLETILAKGGSYILPAELKLTKPLDVYGEVTFDLNGNKVTYADGFSGGALFLVHRGGKLIVNDSKGGGSIDSYNNNWVSGILLTASSDETNDSIKSMVAIVEINAGTIKGNDFAVVGNGSRHGTQITINGGTLESKVGPGIYHPQDGTLTIKGGTIIGEETGVELRSGKLIITGGTFTSRADSATVEPNGSGTTTAGAALAVVQHTTKKNINVTISGGTFKGVYSLFQKDIQNNNPDNVTMSVTGGNFNGEVYSQNCTTFVKGGTFSDPSVVTNYLAQNANVKVVLNKDYTGPGFGLYNEKNSGYGKGATIDVDLNQFTWNVEDTPLFGSTGYETQYFHLEKETTVTFKNGTIQPKDNGGKMMIQNYCNLTLQNVSVIGGTNCSYVISNNNGKCDINNSTITATDNNCAFDVYSFGKYEGVIVTINGSSEINGKVEFGGNNNKQNGTLIVNGGTLNGNLDVTEGYVKEDKSNLQVNGGTWGDYSGWSNYTTSSYPPSNK